MMTGLLSISPLAGALLMVTSAAMAESPNRVLGTWQMVSSKLDPDGANRDVMGPTPSGFLIFTRDMTFAVVVRDPTIQNFASPDRAKATAAENKAAMAGGLGLFGTYTVDAEGNFASEHVIGSTFPNWSGLDRTTSSLREVVSGDTMTEYLEDPGAPKIRIVWKKVTSVSD